MVYENICKLVLAVSLLVLAVTYHFKDKLPKPREYGAPLTAPHQSPTLRSPFFITENNQQYTIKPKFDYELTGVVMTYSDAAGFTNIWHHRRWKDFINVRDLCVIWGDNVRTGVYKNMHFSSDSWTCWVSWNDRETGRIFQSNALSNNHLLTNNNAIKSQMVQAEKGDVVYIKGVLVDYSNQATGGSRKTSISRDDDGNGACETIYVDEFKILKKANTLWRHLFKLAKWTALASFMGCMIFFLKTPFKPR